MTAIPIDGRFNAVVRIRAHFPIEGKPHVETVTCYKVRSELAERPAEIWARRWIDLKIGSA